MMWYRDSWGNGGATMMGLGVLAVVLAVGLTVWFVRSLADAGRHPRLAGGRWLSRPSAYDAAEQLLARRFAAGEIDETQFERARAALRRGRPDEPQS